MEKVLSEAVGKKGVKKKGRDFAIAAPTNRLLFARSAVLLALMDA